MFKRNLYALGLILFYSLGYGQKTDYGLSGNVNISSIFKPTRDSISSGANWGVSMFAEKRINQTWSLSIHPGFQQLSYTENNSPKSWLNGSFEMPVYLHHAPEFMKNGRLMGGVIPSYQVSFFERDLSGSNPSGNRNNPLKINKAFNPGLSAGMNIKISDGFHLNVSCQYYLRTDYRSNAIEGRPAHWQFGLQLRLNELVGKNLVQAAKDTMNPFRYLVVMLPENYGSKEENANIARGRLDTLLLNAFFHHYTISPVIFVRNTMIKENEKPSDSDILYSIRGDKVQIDSAHVYAFVGDYFYKPSSGWHQGIFLLNQNSKLIQFPFSGAYLFPATGRFSEEEWSELFQRKIEALNEDLTQSLKQ